MFQKNMTIVLMLGFVVLACAPEEEVVSPAPPPPQIVQPPADQLAVPYREDVFTKVTDRFGPLTVTEGEFEAESEVKPWSAWWLPINSKYLFEGPNAPLEKYDAYAKKLHNATGSAAAFERDRIYDANAITWEGACDAWAIASLLDKEPILPVKREGITFSIGDLKALLVKTYENAKGKEQFGQRYNGDRESLYDDIYPDQFHRFVQVELFDKKRPFIMDKDPMIAIWNTPVWRAGFKVTRDAHDAHLMHVMATLWGADPWIDNFDYLGSRVVKFQYTYDLIGNSETDGSFTVLFGIWTKTSLNDSISYHPDFVTAVPERVLRGSRNKNIDPKIVDEILGRTRQ